MPHDSKIPATGTWKDRIASALQAPDLQRISDADPVRERPFETSESTFRADFACALAGGGWLIVEDDDAQRALSNLCKYWLWMSEQDRPVPFYLIHLIGPGGNSHKRLCAFVSDKIVAEHSGFCYRQIRVSDWRESDWEPELADALAQVVQQQRGA
jgi:hypothetical protein